jgi:hypothetical protein|tara:strand:+ start:563 stop:949 length:387 start_codon:yes stop_codon:yes gene_type:complete
MRLDTKVIKYRNQNPFMSTRQIAREVDVSVSWTHSILKKANLPTNPPRKKKITYICPECNQLVNARRKFCSEKCKYNYRNPLFTCHYCQVKFRRSRSKVTAAIKNGCKHIYCEQKCTYRAKRDNNADL